MIPAQEKLIPPPPLPDGLLFVQESSKRIVAGKMRSMINVIFFIADRGYVKKLTLFLPDKLPCLYDFFGVLLVFGP